MARKTAPLPAQAAALPPVSPRMAWPEPPPPPPASPGPCHDGPAARRRARREAIALPLVILLFGTLLAAPPIPQL